MPEVWRKCSSCKKDLFLGQLFYVCSVSTCRGNKTNYAFCSVTCWDAHVPTERHRPDSAGAIEKTAPKELGMELPDAPKRVFVTTTSKAPNEEILVVVSKVKKYILDRSGMNTSGSVYALLTEKIQRLCDRAIDEARAQGRKTVMDRDFLTP